MRRRGFIRIRRQGPVTQRRALRGIRARRSSRGARTAALVTVALKTEPADRALPRIADGTRGHRRVGSHDPSRMRSRAIDPPRFAPPWATTCAAPARFGTKLQASCTSSRAGPGCARRASALSPELRRLRPELQIDHGTLTFYGSLAIPAINVLAMRRGSLWKPSRGARHRYRPRCAGFVPRLARPEKLRGGPGRGPADVSQGDAATLLAARARYWPSATPRPTSRSVSASTTCYSEGPIRRAPRLLPQTTVAGRTGTSAREVGACASVSQGPPHRLRAGARRAEGARAHRRHAEIQLLGAPSHLTGVDAVTAGPSNRKSIAVPDH